MNLKKKFILLDKNIEKYNFLKNGLVNRKSGVNFSGKKTCRSRGFINKRKIRTVDYFRAFWHIKFYILNFSYDSNRNTLINLIQYSNQSFSFIISIEGVKLNTVIMNGYQVQLLIGTNTLLNKIPKGTVISNIETYLYSGSKLLRSSGSFCKLLSKGKYKCSIIFKSKKLKKLSKFSTAVIGSVLNFNYSLNKYRKASYFRYKGFRSKVRGVAMNPVDHPHGGGEGKKSKKSNPMSPWGKTLNFVKR